MKVFVCSNCSEIKTQRLSPQPEGCKKTLFHQWRDLGETGKQQYHCKNCGITVGLLIQPSVMGCSAGIIHYWKKLETND